MPLARLHPTLSIDGGYHSTASIASHRDSSSAAAPFDQPPMAELQIPRKTGEIWTESLVVERLRRWWNDTFGAPLPWSSVRIHPLPRKDTNFKRFLQDVEDLPARAYGLWLRMYTAVLFYSSRARGTNRVVSIHGVIPVHVLLQSSIDRPLGRVALVREQLPLQKYRPDVPHHLRYAQCNNNSRSAAFLYLDEGSDVCNYGKEEQAAVAAYDERVAGEDHSERMRTLCELFADLLRVTRRFVLASRSAAHRAPLEADFRNQFDALLRPRYSEKADFSLAQHRIDNIRLRRYAMLYAIDVRDPVEALSAEIAAGLFVQRTFELGWVREICMEKFFESSSFASGPSSFSIAASGALSASDDSWRQADLIAAPVSGSSAANAVPAKQDTQPMVLPVAPARRSAAELSRRLQDVAASSLLLSFMAPADPSREFSLMEGLAAVLSEPGRRALAAIEPARGLTRVFDARTRLSAEPSWRQVLVEELPTRVYFVLDTAHADQFDAFAQQASQRLATLISGGNLSESLVIALCAHYEWIPERATHEQQGTTVLVFPALVCPSLCKLRERIVAPLRNELCNSGEAQFRGVWIAQKEGYSEGTVVSAAPVCHRVLLQPLEEEARSEWLAIAARVDGRGTGASETKPEDPCEGTAFEKSALIMAQQAALQRFARQYSSTHFPPARVHLRPCREFISEDVALPLPNGKGTCWFSFDPVDERGLPVVRSFIGPAHDAYVLCYTELGYWLGQRTRSAIRALRALPERPQLVDRSTEGVEEPEEREAMRRTIEEACDIFGAPDPALALHEESSASGDQSSRHYHPRTGRVRNLASSSSSPPPRDTAPSGGDDSQPALAEPKREVVMPPVSVQTPPPAAPGVGEARVTSEEARERERWRFYADLHPQELYATFRSNPDPSFSITEAYCDEKDAEGKTTSRKTFDWVEYPLRIGGRGSFSLVLFSLYKYEERAPMSELAFKGEYEERTVGRRKTGETIVASKPAWQWIALARVSKAAIYERLKEFYESRDHRATAPEWQGTGESYARKKRRGPATEEEVASALEWVRSLYEQDTAPVSDGCSAARYERDTRGFGTLMPRLMCEESPYTRFAPALAYTHARPEGERHRPPKRTYPAVVYFCVGDDTRCDALPPESQVVGCQRVYLEEDTAAKVAYEDASVNAAKKSAGPLAMANGFFWAQPGRLEDLPVVYLAEGPEKAKAVAIASPCACVYASLGVQNFGRFRRHLRVRRQDAPDGVSRPLLALCLDYECPGRDDEEAREKRRDVAKLVRKEVQLLNETGWTVVCYEIDAKLRCKDWDEVLALHGRAVLQDQLHIPHRLRLDSLSYYATDANDARAQWTRYSRDARLEC